MVNVGNMYSLQCSRRLFLEVSRIKRRSPTVPSLWSQPYYLLCKKRSAWSFRNWKKWTSFISILLLIKSILELDHYYFCKLCFSDKCEINNFVSKNGTKNKFICHSIICILVASSGCIINVKFCDCLKTIFQKVKLIIWNLISLWVKRVVFKLKVWFSFEAMRSFLGEIFIMDFFAKSKILSVQKTFLDSRFKHND